MADQLTNEEKISIINSHKKNIAYNKYGIQLSLIEENAKSTPNSTIVSNYNEQLVQFDLQTSALDAELASLQNTTI